MPTTTTVRRRIRRAVVLVVLVVALLVAAGLIYRAVRNSGAAAAVSLTEVEVRDGASALPPPGAWSVSGGVVGYRVFEPLDVTVTGRSVAVDGELQLDVADEGVVLVDARVAADLGELRSDAAGRDQALRTRLLETDRYPTAAFVLDRPVTVADLPLGVPADVTAAGTLTVRENDQPVQARLQIRWDGTELRIAGQLDVSLSGYGVDVPSAGGVASIDDGAVVEIDVAAVPS